MLSLNRSSFLKLQGNDTRLCGSRRRGAAAARPVVVRCGSGRRVEGKGRGMTLEMSHVEVEELMDPKNTVGGGVEDTYGEDRASKDQPVTPWTVSVARS